MRRKLIALLFCLAGAAHTADAPATLNEDMAAFFAARAASKAAAGMREKSNFIFERHSPTRLRMTYEWSQDGSTWKLGDYIDFERG
jgi:hypothetical protein